MVSDDFAMFTVTNESIFLGASAILDTGLLSKLAEKMETDLCILPSSIHEIIIMPVTEDLYTFEAMVKDINATQLRQDERLSNSVYVYDRKQNKVLKV